MEDGVFGGYAGLQNGAELVFSLEGGGEEVGSTVVGRAERRRVEFWSQDCAVGRYGIFSLGAEGKMRVTISRANF